MHVLVVLSVRTLPLPAESADQQRQRHVAELTRLLQQLPQYMQQKVQQLTTEQKQQFLYMSGDQKKAYFQKLEQEYQMVQQQDILQQQRFAAMGGQPAAWQPQGQATNSAAAALTRCANHSHSA